MGIRQIFEWIELDFIKRPFVIMAGGLLLPYVTRAVTDSVIFANSVLIIIGLVLMIETYRAFAKRTMSSKRFLTATLATWVVIGLVCTFLWQKENKFLLTYLGSELNGQEIELNKGVNLKDAQTQMYIDPTTPLLFGIGGISAINKGTIPLEPDTLYLSFSGYIPTKEPYGDWELAPDRKIKGWTTFMFQFSKPPIGPQHPLAIPPFHARPVPPTSTKVRLVLVHGSSESSAEFTLKP